MYDLASSSLAEGRWAEAFLIGLAGLLVLRALARQVPWQNVVTVVLIIAALSIGFLAAGIFVGGSSVWKRFTRPACISLGAGILSILNAYLVAQLLLQPWRKRTWYGWWLMGVSSLLVVIFQLAWVPFVTEMDLDRVAQSSIFPVPSVSCGAGWFLVALASLFLATPWLIDKRGVESAPDYQPLWVWLLLNLWLIVGNLAHQHWAAVVLSLACNVLVAVGAMRGRTGA